MNRNRKKIRKGKNMRIYDVHKWSKVCMLGSVFVLLIILVISAFGG